MARKKTIEVGGINIRLHPHENKDIYKDLFMDAHALKVPVQVHGDRHLMLSFLSITELESKNILSGSIARFTEIDIDLPWYDVSALDEAQDTDMKEVNIPDSLRPNYSAFNFIFDIKTHRFAVETVSDGATLSIRFVKKFLETLLNSGKLVKKYGVPSIDLMNNSEDLNTIWRMHRLNNLNISIQKPNPDLQNDEDFNKKVQDRLLAQNAQTLDIHLKSVPAKSLIPDDETKLLAGIAINNGTVYADGQDNNGAKIEYSSEDHPRKEREKYDPDTISTFQAFKRAAMRFFL